PGTKAIPNLVGLSPVYLGIGGIHALGDHPDAIDFPRLLNRVRGGPRVGSGRYLLQLALQLFGALLHCLDAFGHFLGRALEELGGAVDLVLEVPHVGQRAGTGESDDSANPRGNRRIGNQLEQANVPGPAYVGASAKLHRVRMYAYHPDPLAVLLAKQSHRAGALCLRSLNDFGPGFGVFADPLVDDVLTPLQLLRAGRGKVRVIEAQVIGGYHRTRLLDVVSENQL